MKQQNVNLLQLVWQWVVRVKDRAETALFRYLLARHGCAMPSMPYNYWINIVECRGGGEKMQPCEYIFGTPWQAELHRRVVDDCPTWRYVTTVMVYSKDPLTETDYKSKLMFDGRLSGIIEAMRKDSPTTALSEMMDDEKSLLMTEREIEQAKRRYYMNHQHGN